MTTRITKLFAAAAFMVASWLSPGSAGYVDVPEEDGLKKFQSEYGLQNLFYQNIIGGITTLSSALAEAKFDRDYSADAQESFLPEQYDSAKRQLSSAAAILRIIRDDNDKIPPLLIPLADAGQEDARTENFLAAVVAAGVLNRNARGYEYKCTARIIGSYANAPAPDDNASSSDAPKTPDTAALICDFAELSRS